MRRWNRKRKVLRNLLLCVLLGAAAYVLLGFPPYTVGQKLDRLGRTYMLEDLEPGDYVMVHAGIAIAKITDEDEQESRKVMEELL